MLVPSWHDSGAGIPARISLAPYCSDEHTCIASNHSPAHALSLTKRNRCITRCRCTPACNYHLIRVPGPHPPMGPATPALFDSTRRSLTASCLMLDGTPPIDPRHSTTHLSQPPPPAAAAAAPPSQAQVRVTCTSQAADQVLSRAEWSIERPAKVSWDSSKLRSHPAVQHTWRL